MMIEAADTTIPTYTELYDMAKEKIHTLSEDNLKKLDLFDWYGNLYRIVTTPELVFDIAAMERKKCGDKLVIKDVLDEYNKIDTDCYIKSLEISREKYIISPEYAVGYFMGDILEYVYSRYSQENLSYIVYSRDEILNSLIVDIKHGEVGQENSNISVSVTSKIYTDYVPFNFRIACLRKINVRE